MKEYKTIIKKIDKADEFDQFVNGAVKDGWTVIERQVVRGFSQGNYLVQETTLVAFLEREIK